MFRKVTLIIFLATVMSCSLLSKDKDFSKEYVPGQVESLHTGTSYVSYGQIVNADALFLGNDILVSPFDIALNVEDSDELRQASLMAVRGVIDVFEGCYEKETGQFPSCKDLTDYEKGDYNLIFSKEEESVDFVLEGNIVEARGGGVFGIPFTQKKKSLLIEGKIIEDGTGNVVAVFRDQLDAADKRESFSDLARQSGQNIGQFIFTIIKKSAY